MSSIIMDQKQLEKLDTELTKGVKTESDLANPLGQLMKLTIQKALDVEMDNLLGYEKHSKEGRSVLE